MKNFFRKIKEIWSNKWVKFTVVSIIYLLLFVVWTGNLWLLLGLPLIYDIYISKYMYRYVGSRHVGLKKRSRVYKKTAEWVEAIVFAMVVTTFIKLFIFAFYVIPTPSMEKSLLVGDYLCVSKVAYGPQVPNTPLSFPLVHNLMPFSETKKSFSEAIQWPYHRLKGFGNVRRGDVVVFNFPAGDTVILEIPNATYYDYLREYENVYGPGKGREMLFNQYNIISRPVDKRDNYVKRAVGIPGDVLQIKDSRLTVNGQPLQGDYKIQYVYFVRTNGTILNRNTLKDMGISDSDISYNQGISTYVLPLTSDNAEKIKSLSNVLEVTQYVAEGSNPNVFPHDPAYGWNEDNFGPITVPGHGRTVKLTTENLPVYRDIISKYEGNSLVVQNEEIFINGVKADHYTFAMDYFFMMGDNRHNSADSRFWGFVPEDHIVGKASFIWLSIDNEKKFPANIRWNRMFRRIK